MGYNSVKNSYIKVDIPSVDRVVPSGEGMGGTPPGDLDPLPIKTQICPPPHVDLGSPSHHPKFCRALHTKWFIQTDSLSIRKFTLKKGGAGL